VKDDETDAAGDLLLRARAGEPAAFSAVVRKYQKSVYGIALRMLSDPHKAEELAQEVFLQLYRKLQDIESDAHLAFWLRKVTANRAIDRLRQEPRHEAVSLEDESGLASEPDNEDPLLQRRLRELVAQLPAAARAVIVLRYQEDLDPTEISRALNMPINTVKSHLKRSLATLRARVLGPELSLAHSDRSPAKREPLS
jgi:RNA polymerase sigma-70 factor (ECF subfamily)